MWCAVVADSSTKLAQPMFYLDERLWCEAQSGDVDGTLRYIIMQDLSLFHHRFFVNGMDPGQAPSFNTCLFNTFPFCFS